MIETLKSSNLRILKIFTENWNILENVFTWKVTITYVDMWNRSEVFRKSKTSWGVKLDYNDRISKSSKFADIVNFYRKLWNILANVFAWKVSLMYVDVWNWTYLWYKFLICLETGWKPKVTSSLVLNLEWGSESGSESGSVWHLIRLG